MFRHVVTLTPMGTGALSQEALFWRGGQIFHADMLLVKLVGGTVLLASVYPNILVLGCPLAWSHKYIRLG